MISVPPAGGLAMPGAMPGLAGAFGPMLPPGLISPGLPAVPAPPPRARPAAPPGVYPVYVHVYVHVCMHGVIRAEETDGVVLGAHTHTHTHLKEGNPM